MQERNRCPICNRLFLKRAIKLHIINAAKGEAYRDLLFLLKIAKNKPYEFSPLVMRSRLKHVNYILKNLKLIEKFKP